MPSSIRSRVASALSFLLPPKFRPRKPVVAVIRLSGPIGMQSFMRPSLTLGSLAATLESAFAVSPLSAVALLINSPGGSAVQSHLIYQRIRALADEKDVPVFAFTEDAAASGGYMLALAADEIFSDPSSIVGSIGVVAAGFGFNRLIERFGIDRRVYTAGEEKAMLDPFQPEHEEDVARLKRIQAAVHTHFIALVKCRRGTRLKGEDDVLFTGAFWSAEEAVKLGLVDGVGDLRSVMRQRFGDKVRLRLVARPRGLGLLFGNPAQALFSPFAESEGGTPARTVLDPRAWLAALAERALWGRYGL